METSVDVKDYENGIFDDISDGELAHYAWEDYMMSLDDDNIPDDTIGEDDDLPW
jgi:hypothetical protein